MIPVFGLSDSHSHPIEDEPSPGLDSDMVCNFICNAFDSPNSDVRSAAVQAMAEVYRINPQKAQQVTTGVKPKLLELIRIAFKEADEQKGDQPPPVFYEQKKSPRVDSGLPKKAKNSSSSDLSKQPSKSSSSKQLDKKPDSKQPPPPSSSSSSSSSSQPSQKQPNNTQKQPNNPPNQTNTQKQKKEQKSETSSNSNNSNNNNTNNNHRVLSPSPSPSSSPIPPNHTHEDSDAFQVYTNESTRCQFCGLEDENFTEDLLDQHYMRDCPMLCECDCEQVIEISCLNEHQLTECDNAPHRAACPNCKMALPDFDLEAHIAECPESWAQATWQQCPLCYNPTPLLTSKQWFLHLSKECPNNPRNDLAASTY